MAHAKSNGSCVRVWDARQPWFIQEEIGSINTSEKRMVANRVRAYRKNLTASFDDPFLRLNQAFKTMREL